jgi:hypothetical protein
MDNTLILVKIITLLFLESKLGDESNSSAEMCRTLLELVKPPEEKLALSETKDVLHHLKSTALLLISSAPHTVLDSDDLLQRLRVNCTGDEDLYKSFEQVIDKAYEKEELIKKILAMRHGLADMQRDASVDALIRKSYQELTWGRDKIKNLKNWAFELSNKLADFKEFTKKKDPAVVSDVDFTTPNAVTSAFLEMQEEQSDEGIMRTGWKGLNEMLQGGFRRGEQWVIPALQHSYKTGFTLTLFKQISMYNKPYMLNVEKKPLLLRISFEDTMSQNLRYLLENVHFNKHGVMPELKDMSVEEMARPVMDAMKCNGYSIIMRRINATLWGYKDVMDSVIELESQGYEIHMCIIDYLSLLPKVGCEEGPMGFALRDLFRRIRAFFSARKITLITPHQLSTEAKQLVRDGHNDFLSQVVGRGYYADCKQIDQEVDGELYLHKVKFNKRTYLVMRRGKHRGVPVIKEELMEAIYMFPEVGPIPDDLETHRSDLTRIGGRQVSEKGKFVEEDSEEMAF